MKRVQPAKPVKKLAGPLLRAATSGDTAKVRALLAAGANPDERVTRQPTPLIAAAMRGGEEVIRTLLKAGADPNFKHGSGTHATTALREAVRRDQFAAARVLVAAGASAKFDWSGKGQTIAFEAIRRCNELHERASAGAARGKKPAPVIKACLKLIEAMLAAGGKPARPCLPDTVGSGNVPLMRALLSHGVKINEQDRDQTAFSVAVNHGRTNIALELLRRGADPNMGSTLSGPPLHTAVVEGMAEVIKAAIAAKADLNCRATVTLKEPVKKTSPALPEAISFQLNLGEDYIEHERAYESTPLIVAVRCRDPKIVRILVQGGADLEARDADGFTALAWALKLDRSDIAGLLRRAGARDAGIAGSPFHRLINACIAGDLVEARAAVAAGADVNQMKQTLGEEATPLMYAARGGHLAIVNELLKAGADPNRAGREQAVMVGVTPLMWAARYGHVEVVRRLLAIHGNAGAQARVTFNLRDKGDSALHEAARNGRAAVVKALLQAGIAPNLRSGWSTSPLVEACESGDAETVKALLEAGADPNPIARNKTTPLQAAASSGNRKLVQMLKTVIANAGAKGAPSLR